VTKEEHRELHRTHRKRADTLRFTLDVELLAFGPDELAVKTSEYHDELTAASAHLALAMLLEGAE